MVTLLAFQLKLPIWHLSFNFPHKIPIFIISIAHAQDH